MCSGCVVAVDLFVSFVSFGISFGISFVEWKMKMKNDSNRVYKPAFGGRKGRTAVLRSWNSSMDLSLLLLSCCRVAVDLFVEFVEL